MTKNCLDNVNNYANSDNSVILANSLTCRFSWLYREASNEVFTVDFSTIPDGDSIALITVDILDGTNTSSNTGTTIDAIAVDVSTLDPLVQWRINYTVETTNGLTCTIFIFIDPTDRENTTGSSDPNFNPAALPPFFAPAASKHPVQVFEYDFLSSTNWSFPHGTGLTYPLSIELYDASDARIFTGINIVDTNNFNITFFTARAGKGKVIFADC